MEDILFFTMPDKTWKDFTDHNQSVRELWTSFAQDRHKQIPIRLNTNPRMLMLDTAYHRRPPDYHAYMTNPDVMAQCILEWSYWVRFLLPGDHEKGFPESWQMHVDFQNFYDAAFFGAKVDFHEGQVPYAVPCLNEDNKRMLFDRGLPDPFSGEWGERALRFRDYFEKRSRNGWTFLGRPVEPAAMTPFMVTDGPFTAAAALRGPTGICADLLEDPDYVNELLDYISDALIARMQAWRNHYGVPFPAGEWVTADDSVEMLSLDQYREFVLPRHKRLFDAMLPNGKRGIHLCGNAQRLFPVLRKELDITVFDTGFPVDFALFRREMGEDTLIAGGPPAPLFVGDSPEALLAETERILGSGILRGGRFILQEGNNLPPRTPMAYCELFYALGKEKGLIPC